MIIVFTTVKVYSSKSKTMSLHPPHYLLDCTWMFSLSFFLECNPFFFFWSNKIVYLFYFCRERLSGSSSSQACKPCKNSPVFSISLSSVINRTCETIKIELKLIKIKIEEALFSCGCFLAVERKAKWTFRSRKLLHYITVLWNCL